nr:unnamed protein product [Callosobruchus analis]
MNKDLLCDLRLAGGLSLGERLRSIEEEDYSPTDPTIDINLMPPVNANDSAYDTDEDSSDADEVSIYNLPGSQLRGQALLQERFENQL